MRFQVKSAMTMTEKILARASERASLEPGENVWVDVDVLMTHDLNANVCKRHINSMPAKVETLIKANGRYRKY